MKPKKAPQNSKKQKFSGLTALVTGSNSGIGLAIAAAITEKHGGRITAAMDGDRLVFTCQLSRETRK